MSRAGSPVELAVPTLNDNVDEDLEVVRQTLRNVGHTHTFRGTHPRPDPEGGPSQEQQAPSEEQISIPAGHDGGDGLTGEEEVLEGHVVGGGNNLKVEAVGGDARSEEGGNARSEAVGGDARHEEGGNARSEEDEMAGADYHYYRGELAGDPEACVTATGRLGSEDMEFSILSENLEDSR